MKILQQTFPSFTPFSLVWTFLILLTEGTI